jgi:hypothetical protein
MAETGHARNIGHFGTVIAFVDGYGAACDRKKRAKTLIYPETEL